MIFTTNQQNIIATSARSALIKIERSEFKFWIAKKMIRDLGGWQVSVLVPEHWSVRVFRNGKGQYNYWEILEEKEVSVAELKNFYPKEKEFEN